MDIVFMAIRFFRAINTKCNSYLDAICLECLAIYVKKAIKLTLTSASRSRFCVFVVGCKPCAEVKG